MQTELILQKTAGTALKIPFLRFQPLPKEVVSASGSESKKAYIAQIYYNITDGMINLAHKHSDSINQYICIKKMVKWSKNVNQA